MFGLKVTTNYTKKKPIHRLCHGNIQTSEHKKKCFFYRWSSSFHGALKTNERYAKMEWMINKHAHIDPRILCCCVSFCFVWLQTILIAVIFWMVLLCVESSRTFFFDFINFTYIYRTHRAMKRDAHVRIRSSFLYVCI